MEKLLIVISFALLIFGCEPLNKSTNPKFYGASVFENKQQVDFDSFLKNKDEQKYSYYNDIQRKEFSDEFDKDLSTYLDSVKLFVNWLAIIKDIKTKESNGYTILSFELYYKPEEHRTISFNCSYPVKTDSLANDYLYNQVKKIPNQYVVYFDGFIKKDKNNNVVYNYASNYSFEILKISNPSYRFNVLRVLPITVSQKPDTLSVPLKKVIEINFKIFDLFKQRLNKTFSKQELGKKMDLLYIHINKIESKFTPTEKKYILRLKQYLYDDLRL